MNRQREEQDRNPGTSARITIPFKAFDPDANIQRGNGKLENWEQPGACYFVTFRIGDSIPSDILGMWQEERDAWDKNNPPPQTESQMREYEQRFTEREEEWLDRGIGECHLRSARIQKVVCDSLPKFDSKRYFIDAFVIMPNHVHLLWQMDETFSNMRELKSMKGVTARVCR